MVSDIESLITRSRLLIQATGESDEQISAWKRYFGHRKRLNVFVGGSRKPGIDRKPLKQSPDSVQRTTCCESKINKLAMS